MRLLDFAPRAVATFAIAAGLLAFVPAFAVHAEDPSQPAPASPAPPAPDTNPQPTPPPVRQVGEVAVTATRAERNVLDTPGNVTVIDRAEIEKSGARDVPELLRRESGLFVTDVTGNPTGYTVDARGFNNGGGNGSALLVLMDGRRMNEADSSFIDWSLVHLDRVERIEIVRGPASSLYGDNAMGGVVQIITKDGAGKPSATLSGRVGSYDELTGSLFAGGSEGPFTASLYADGYGTDGYRQHSDYNSNTLVGKLRWTPTDAASFEVSSGYSADDRKQPGTLTEARIHELGRNAQQPFTDNFDAAHERWVQGLGQVIVAKDITLKVLPYWRSRRDSGEFNNLDPESTLGPFVYHFQTDTESWGGSTQVEIDRPIERFRNRAIGGFDFLHDGEDQSTQYPLYASSNQTNAHRRIWGLFVQDEFSILENLILSGGLRYDSADYRGKSVDQPLFGAPPKLEGSPDELSPRAALTWRFMPSTSAYASYAKGFRLPNFNEAISFTGKLFNLKPQTSNAYEVGVKHRSATLSANLALYWMNVSDEIFYDPEAIPYAQNVNLGRVRHRGIEASSDWRPLHWLELYGSYTYDDTRVLHDGVLSGRRMPITPLNRGTAGFFVFLPWYFEVGCNANVVGPRSFSNDLQRAFGALSTYYTLDTTILWRRPIGEHIDLAVLFRIKNLTDQHYEEFGAPSTSLYGTPIGLDPAPGRNYEGGLTVSWK